MHPSLEGRRFRSAEMSDEGEAGAEAVFEYHEDGDLVWGRYRGGAVRLGYLVGTRDGDRLDFRLQPTERAGRDCERPLVDRDLGTARRQASPLGAMGVGV